MSPENDPASPAQKPGWKTSEFWLSLLAMLLGALLASDAIPTDSPTAKALGVVASILGALGYQVTRAAVKASGNKAAAFVAASGAPVPPPSPPQP
jgi:hypothetical protein